MTDETVPLTVMTDEDGAQWIKATEMQAWLNTCRLGIISDLLSVALLPEVGDEE